MNALPDPRYTLSPDGKSITCGTCGRTSHNPKDVAHRFCGNCHEFLDGCSAEYDCSECGRHILQFGGPVTGKCAACWSIPGWWNNPEIARVIDPGGDARPRRLQ